MNVLGLHVPPALLDELRAAWSSPGRAYHTWDHLLDVLAHLDTVPSWDDPASVAVAALFHDAVYVAGAPDNEARSADAAVEAIARYALPADPARVAHLIGLTAAHGRLDPADLDADAAHFLDADTAILGADPEAFAAYDRQIAAEWVQVVPPDAYAAGRRRFLQAMLDRPIFHTAHFRERYEAAARVNVARQLATGGFS